MQISMIAQIILLLCSRERCSRLLWMARKLDALRWADKEENMKALKSISIALNIASIVLSVFTIGYILHRRKIGGDLLHENEDSIS